MNVLLVKRRHVLLLLVIFTIASAAASIWFGKNLLSARSDSATLSRQAAIKAVSGTVSEINEKIEGLKVAHEIAAELTSGRLKLDRFDEDLLSARLVTALKKGGDKALTVAWLPKFQPEHPGKAAIEPTPCDESATEPTPCDEAAIYFMTAHKRGEELGVNRDRMYTRSMVENQQKGKIDSWYAETLSEKRETWFASPYHSPSSGKWWSCGYSVPFSINGEVAGVVAAELTAELANFTVYKAEYSAFMESDLPPDASYGMLISRSGVIFSHPDLEVVKEHQKISDFIKDFNSPAEIPDLYTVVEGMHDPAFEGVIYEKNDFKFERTGQTLSLYFSPIAETGWWAVVVLDQQTIDESAENRSQLKTMQTWVLLTALLVCFGLFMLVLRIDRPTAGKLWAVTSVFSILCVVAITWVLNLSYTKSLHIHPQETVLKNRAVAAKEMMHYSEEHGKFPAAVPTGVFIQSTEFSSANNVTVTGLIWQRFDKTMPDSDWLLGDPAEAEPGFFLPEAEEASIAFSYRRPDGDAWVYGWTFRAVLRQEFEYQKFPFDAEEIWVRIWPRDWGKGLLLTPDLKSYTTLVPEDLPGLELQDFVLEGWNVNSTYFSYRHNRYNTNFGSTDFEAGTATVPELYFNIGMNRVFLNAFIMNFITLTVVAFLLFAVLYTVRTNERAADLLGFNVAAVLGFCAALFFVVIVAHTSLRESLAAQSLVYLEYYFFAMYIAFLGVSINAIMVASETRYQLIDYGDNLVARLLYWPLLCFSILGVTLALF